MAAGSRKSKEPRRFTKLRRVRLALVVATLLLLGVSWHYFHSSLVQIDGIHRLRLFSATPRTAVPSVSSSAAGNKSELLAHLHGSSDPMSVAEFATMHEHGLFVKSDATPDHQNAKERSSNNEILEDDTIGHERAMALPPPERDSEKGSEQSSEAGVFGTDLPLLIGITPTYPRAFQAIHFIHLTNLLRTVPPPFLWIVVESPNKTEETSKLLDRTARRCLPTGAHNCRALDVVHLETGDAAKLKWNTAVSQRNAALDYIEEKRISGVVYFMDDDNTYDAKLFEELRKIRRVGVFPVGFLYTLDYAYRNTKLFSSPFVERPLVKPDPESGQPKVYGWETFEWSFRGKTTRKFNLDMAGFSFHSNLMWSNLTEYPGFPRHPIRFEKAWQGYLETVFLGKLVPGIRDVEPLASSCTEVLVWHIHTEAPPYLPYPVHWRLPQPRKLEKVALRGSTWRYLIGEDRYGIQGWSERGIPLGYKGSKVEDYGDEEGGEGDGGEGGEEGEDGDGENGEGSSEDGGDSAATTL